MGTEHTGTNIDTREHLTVAHPIPGEIVGPAYRNLWGPSQWPAPSILPDFIPSFKNYIEEVARVDKMLRELMAEAIGIDGKALSSLFDETQQYRMRMIKYPALPVAAEVGNLHALGAHQDHAFTVLIYQVTEHVALQVRNGNGAWINCPPKPGSLVFVVGKSAQAATYGACLAAMHRVTALPPGSTDRFSIAVGTNLRYDTSVLSPSSMQALETIQRNVSARYPGIGETPDEYLSPLGALDTLGMKVLHNYCVSHPEIMRKWVRSMSMFVDLG
jgi:isopenicillin N synthase-like dioxygenase